jgi:hypothetical protein
MPQHLKGDDVLHDVAANALDGGGTLIVEDDFFTADELETLDDH